MFRLTRFFLIGLVFGGLSCSARPGWVLRLPENPSALGARSFSPLIGSWARTVDSRYGVGNPRAHSLGSETILIQAGADSDSVAQYTKIHLYREQVGFDQLTRGYREFGTMDRRGQYTLFTPERSENSGPIAITMNASAPGLARDAGPDATTIQLPEVAELAWQPTSAPAALLYFFEPEHTEQHPNFRTGRIFSARLTPLAYEAFGVIYEYGIFEGTEHPYDFSSKNFCAALEIWNRKRNQPHAYVLD